MSATPSAASSAPSPAILALDTASPTVSVALARGGEVLARDRVEIGHSSRRLLPMIDAAVGQAGLEPSDLDGIVALAGPGSFTGLRVGLATALGLHQALGVPSTAIPTLPELARSVPAPRTGAHRVFALVDVLRDEWACQEFQRPADAIDEPGAAAGVRRQTVQERGEAERIPAPELLSRVTSAVEEMADLEEGQVVLVGFAAEALRSRLGPVLTESAEAGGLRIDTPRELAASAALAAALEPPRWDVASLTSPLYFRPPATTRPKAFRSPPPPTAGA